MRRAVPRAPPHPFLPRRRRPASPPRGGATCACCMGLLLVLAAVVLGSRLLGSQGATVPVWSAARDLSAGAPLGPGDVQRVDVRLGDTAAEYVSASDPLPAGLTVTRPVAEGELLPAGAVVAGTRPVETRLVTVTVDRSRLPGSLESRRPRRRLRHRRHGGARPPAGHHARRRGGWRSPRWSRDGGQAGACGQHRRRRARGDPRAGAPAGRRGAGGHHRARPGARTVTEVGVLLAVGGLASEQQALAALDRPARGVRVVRRCVDLADLLGAAGGRTASVAVVSAGPAPARPGHLHAAQRAGHRGGGPGARRRRRAVAAPARADACDPRGRPGRAAAHDGGGRAGRDAATRGRRPA